MVKIVLDTKQNKALNTMIAKRQYEQWDACRCVASVTRRQSKLFLSLSRK